MAEGVNPWWSVAGTAGRGASPKRVDRLRSRRVRIIGGLVPLALLVLLMAASPSHLVLAAPAAGHVPPAPRLVPVAHAQVVPSSSGTPQVKATLVLYNNTLVPGNLVSPDGLWPSEVAYDPAQGQVWVGSAAGVSFINDTTNAVVGGLPGPYDAGRNAPPMAFDPVRGAMYVGGLDGGGVVAVNVSTDSVVSTFPLNVSTNQSYNGTLPYPVRAIQIAYDAGQQKTFVVDDTNNLTVIDDRTNRIVAEFALPIALPQTSDSLAYCPNIGAMVVTTNTSLIVVNDTTDQLVLDRSLTSGSLAGALATSGSVYDPTHGELLMGIWPTPLTGNGSTGEIAWVNDTTWNVSTTLPIDEVPLALAVDPASQRVLASTPTGVLVVNDSNFSIVKQIVAGLGADAFALDPARGEVYIANQDAWNVTVLAVSSGRLVANIAIGSAPSALTYASGTSSIYVENSWLGGSASLVSGSSNRISGSFTGPSGSGPFGPSAAYDPTLGEVFLVDSGDHWVSVINDSSRAVVGTLAQPNGSVGPASVVYDARTSQVVVSYVVSGTLVVYNATSRQPVANVSVGGTPEWLAAGLGGIFVANTMNGTVDVVNDSTDRVVAWIGVGATPGPLAIDANRSELFVAPYGSSNLTVIDAANDSLAGNVSLPGAPGPSFGMPSDLAYDDAQGELFVTNPATNSVWVVNASTDALNLSLPVGDEPSSVLYDPSNGYVYVSDLASGSLSIIAPNGSGSGTVTFSEATNSSAEPWSVSIHPVVETSGGSPVTFLLTDGTYAYTVRSPAGYRADPAGGNVTIAGGATSVVLSFGVVRYAASFFETGLPAGAPWSVRATDVALRDVVTGTSTTSTIVLELRNGTYAIEATGPLGYSLSLGVTTVTIQGGSPAPVNATFSPNAKPYSAPPGPAAVVPYAWVPPLAALVAVAIGAWVGAVYLRRARWKAESDAWVREFLRDDDPAASPPRPVNRGKE
jgi:DNA-binding beta-propeller fold protein YncE